MADSGDEIVIRDPDGNDHVFPAGFDPQKAAAIVRQSIAARPATAPATPDSGGAMNVAWVNGQRVPVPADEGPPSPPSTFSLGTIAKGAQGLATLLQSPATVIQDQMPDFGKGLLKEAGNTAYGFGKILHDYTPIGRISDAIQPGAFDPANKPPELTGSNPAQKAAMALEQVGEFFLPTGEAGALAKIPGLAKVAPRLAAAIQAAALTKAQGGGAVPTVASGALAAVFPGAGAMESASGMFERSAQQTMADSLRATKEWAKDESAKLAPEMLQRGIGGTFYQMRTLARATAAKVGANLADAYKTAAAAGETVPGDIVRGNVQLARDALQVPDATGTLITIPGHEEAVAKLEALDNFVAQLGQDIPVDKAATVKQAWDEIVSKAGLYGNKATAPASEKAAAWSFREAANAFREKLNTNPDIADLNKEASFWIGLRDVLNATKLRKVGQTGGLLKAGAAATGFTVGGLTGDTYTERAKNAVIGGLAAQQFTRLMQSPWWMSKASAPFKQLIADALASGNAQRVAAMIRTAFVAAPSLAAQSAP